jgi:hypothetical protein
MICFHVELGLEKFIAQQYHIKRSSSSFTGQCFKCGSWRHTQLDCPLTRCRDCGRFGHDARVCHSSRLN